MTTNSLRVAYQRGELLEAERVYGIVGVFYDVYNPHIPTHSRNPRHPRDSPLLSCYGPTCRGDSSWRVGHNESGIGECR